MPRKILPKPSRLRLVVLNDSAPVLKMLCNWLQEHGHHCETALLADMPQAHDEVWPFIQKHRPDVVIYDVGMPYSSSWDLLEVIRAAPALQHSPLSLRLQTSGNSNKPLGGPRPSKSAALIRTCVVC